jgi:eukaryotic translation initiation factor 2C
MELKRTKLEYYLSKHLMLIPYDIFHGINHVMKENTRMNIISHGTSFFEGEPNIANDHERGITASKGFSTTVKATSQGLTMCIDSTI